MAKLSADMRCSGAILAFLGKTEVRRKRWGDEVEWGGGGGGWKRFFQRGQVGGRAVVMLVCLFLFVEKLTYHCRNREFPIGGRERGRESDWWRGRSARDKTGLIFC